MPTKGFSIRIDNYKYLETISAEKGVSPSEYLNLLLEEDMAAPLLAGKKSHEIPRPIKSKSDIIFSKSGDGLHTCKKCGSMLTMYKGKCKLCK